MAGGGPRRPEPGGPRAARRGFAVCAVPARQPRRRRSPRRQTQRRLAGVGGPDQRESQQGQPDRDADFEYDPQGRDAARRRPARLPDAADRRGKRGLLGRRPVGRGLDDGQSHRGEADGRQSGGRETRIGA